MRHEEKEEFLRLSAIENYISNNHDERLCYIDGIKRYGILIILILLFLNGLSIFNCYQFLSNSLLALRPPAFRQLAIDMTPGLVFFRIGLGILPVTALSAVFSFTAMTESTFKPPETYAMFRFQNMADKRERFKTVALAAKAIGFASVAISMISYGLGTFYVREAMLSIEM